MKGHITGGDDNIKHMTNRMVKSIPNHKTKDRVTRTPLKPGDDLSCPGWLSSSFSTSGTRRVNLVTNLVNYYW